MNTSVIGLGKLGCPLAAMLCARGHHVVGVDSNINVRSLLQTGQAPVPEPGLQDLLDRSGSKLRISDDIGDAVQASDITYLIVPTPSRPDGEFSLDLLLPALHEVGAALMDKESRHTIVVTSTVMPGHSDGPIREAIESAAGRPLGDALGLVYNPEFVALGTVVADMSAPDMILIGESAPWAGEVAEEISRSLCLTQPHVARMSLIDAEVTKLAVNTFVTTRISYANTLAELCEKLPGADASVVTAALGHDSRIGSKYLQPATAYGGPCFPRDNIALSALARRVGTQVELAEATHRVNRHQVERLAALVEVHLSPGEGTVAVLGLSYKSGTPVIEEAVGLLLTEALAARGHKVVAYDPMAGEQAREHLGGTAEVADTLDAAMTNAAVAVVTTPWPEFSDLTVNEGTRAIVDCWRHVSPASLPPSVSIYQMGRGMSTADAANTHTLTKPPKTANPQD